MIGFPLHCSIYHMAPGIATGRIRLKCGVKVPREPPAKGLAEPATLDLVASDGIQACGTPTPLCD